jgi:large subunit ribosomal protein L21
VTIPSEPFVIPYKLIVEPATKLAGDAGASVEFDQVLLAEAKGTVSVGAPLLAGAKVSGKILGHVKGDKVIVFKKKRRKGYKKKNGHRQDFTKVKIGRAHV